MNPYKTLLLLSAMLISISAIAQEANIEAINKSLKPKPSDNETYEMMIPDIRLGLNIQGFVTEMSNDKNFTMGTYVKYKPFYRFDIDAGFKYFVSSLDDNEFNFEKDNMWYDYDSYGGTQFYFTLNSSLALNKLNSHTALYTSFEAGYANNKSNLTQYDMGNNKGRIASQKVKDGKMYVEWKLGLNLYGDFLGANTGAKVFVGANNVPYFLSAHTHRKESGMDTGSYNSGMLLFGVAFEFGLKRSAPQKANKARQKENRSIIEKYEGKSDKLF